ncbi:hypothetical protein [Prosthecobacter sp.]|uniref:hypothetical protein n=1 Tax=Prosthecobacter sp. TaxID=1965333 RepID=UPI003783A30F
MKIHLLVVVLLGLSVGSGFGEDAKKKVYDKKVPLKVLSDEEQAKLLGKRLEGGLGDSFGAFANMFMVRSQMDLRVCVGLKGMSKEIAEAELQPVFPEFYKPTLKELMDSIALQTFSAWSYRKEDQYANSSKAETTEDDHLVIFSFTSVVAEAKPRKPYKVELAKGWQAEDRGHWLACRPATFPVGMDIYEMGTYSAKKKEDEAALFEKVRKEVALEWAKRVKPEAKAEDLKPAKVGAYEALHFEAMIPARTGGDVHWRHWVFMVDNACYFIVSTIFPEKEAEYFPDVEKMLGSFTVDKK